MVCICCVLLLLLGVFVYRQWDNLMVLTTVGKYSTEEIQGMMQENAHARSAAVAELQVRMLTEEEKQAIRSGELSEQDALALITGEAVPTAPGPNLPVQEPCPSAPGEIPASGQSPPQDQTAAAALSDPPPTTPAPVSAAAGELARLVGELYVLEASYSGKLEALLDSAIAEYSSLPPEKHTLASKLDIGLRYVGIATSMEQRCDEQVATLLSEIERVLIAAGQDTALVGEIKTAYHNEKNLMKDYYLSLYA